MAGSWDWWWIRRLDWRCLRHNVLVGSAKNKAVRFMPATLFCKGHAAAVELKTRNVLSEDVPWHDVWPQLFFSQIPRVYLGWQCYGNVERYLCFRVRSGPSNPSTVECTQQAAGDAVAKYAWSFWDACRPVSVTPRVL